MDPGSDIFGLVKVLRTISGRDFMSPESEIFRLVKVLRTSSGGTSWVLSLRFSNSM